MNPILIASMPDIPAQLLATGDFSTINRDDSANHMKQQSWWVDNWIRRDFSSANILVL